MFIRHIKKKHQVPNTSLSLHWAIYLHKLVYIFLQDRAAQNMQKCIAYIIYYCTCFPLCAHLLYLDAAKFSINLFSLIYFNVYVVRQRDEYGKSDWNATH